MDRDPYFAAAAAAAAKQLGSSFGGGGTVGDRASKPEALLATLQLLEPAAML
jgi:hypothetical protein